MGLRGGQGTPAGCSEGAEPASVSQGAVWEAGHEYKESGRAGLRPLAKGGHAAERTPRPSGQPPVPLWTSRVCLRPAGLLARNPRASAPASQTNPVWQKAHHLSRGCSQPSQVPAAALPSPLRARERAPIPPLLISSLAASRLGPIHRFLLLGFRHPRMPVSILPFPRSAQCSPHPQATVPSATGGSSKELKARLVSDSFPSAREPGGREWERFLFHSLLANTLVSYLTPDNTVINNVLGCNL